MKRPIRKPELLAPAGDLEKLKTALHYGADAVYLSGENYGLRAGAENFSLEEMAEGVTLAHKKGARVYLALNIFAHNADINSLPSYLREIESIGVDAIIVSDAGVIDVVKESLPGTELHLSTQANTTNWRSIAFWKKQGVSRVCVARELSLDEIREVKDRVDIEIEAFVHGAMCISYSGRCLISSYMTGRSANLGDCAHPCRYRYALVEETRPGEYFPVEEDERGTYMMSSKDLCMIEHLDKMFKAGIGALKIEGRTKGIAYVGNVVRIYRKAIDRYLDNQENYRPEPGWLDELTAVSNRDYTTGFFFGRPDARGQNYLSSSSSSPSGKEFVGVVRRVTGNEVMLEVRNRLKTGETLEFVGVKREPYIHIVETMEGLSGEALLTANPGMTVVLKVAFSASVNDMVRRRT
ncbi:MAG: peptidase [Deltaproteobacteria bacterium]|nr:peptidase [Deltaproteobacteria bacterium]